MPNSFSGSMVTKLVKDVLDDREARVRRGTMWVLRETGRAVKREARAKAPVYKGSPSTVRFSQMNRDLRARRRGTIGPIRGEQKRIGNKIYGPVISGLLKGSIAPGRRLRQDGHDAWTLKVGPRGMRVHLYAAKQERRSHFMQQGEAVAQTQGKIIAERAYAKIWKA